MIQFILDYLDTTKSWEELSSKLKQYYYKKTHSKRCLCKGAIRTFSVGEGWETSCIRCGEVYSED